MKSTLGSSVLVVRPTAVPARFTGGPVMIEYAYVAGSEARYRVGYRAVDGLINVAAGAVNSAAPSATETITVRGQSARYSTTSGWPERKITWTEGDGLLQRSGARHLQGGAVADRGRPYRRSVKLTAVP